MTPHAALLELLTRVGGQDGSSVLLNAEELSRWPTDAVAAMRSQNLLVKARPATSVVCPGCERECVMSVHTSPGGPRDAVSFVVCDKRDDINRVPIVPERLTQWRCNGESVANFVAATLGLRRSNGQRASGGLMALGMATGKRRHQMLCLGMDGELALVAGTGKLPLTDAISYEHGKYSLDRVAVRELIDSARTADPRYTPSNARREARKLDTQATYAEWQKAYRELKKRHPGMSDVWYSQQVAKRSAFKRDAETIRKHMKS